MSKFNRFYVLGMIAAAGALSGCGRNDYNGTYTGTATSGQSMNNSYSQYGYNPYQQPQQGYGINTQDTVALNLKQNGQQVQGTYSSTNSGETGTFYASATTANRLDNVQLVLQQYNAAQNGNTGFQTQPSGYAVYCGGSGYTGSLTAPDDARQIEGTLNATSGLGAQNAQCAAKTFRLIKNQK